MGNSLAAAEIYLFLRRLAEEYTKPATLYVLGGGGLCLSILCYQKLLD